MAAGAGAGAGARAEQQLQRDVSVSDSDSLSGIVVGSVSGSVSGNVGGRFSSSNIEPNRLRQWYQELESSAYVIAAAEHQCDRSGVGGGSLCRGVDGSVGRSCSSIGSGGSRPVYWTFRAM